MDFEFLLRFLEVSGAKDVVSMIGLVISTRTNEELFWKYDIFWEKIHEQVQFR